MDVVGTNIGAYVTSRFALVRSLFGVGVGNLAATDGTAFQRTTKRPLHLSGKLIISYDATMASGQTLTIVSQMKHSSNGSDYTAFASGTSVITADDGGANQKGTVEVDFNLIGAKDYIRPTVAGTLTASGSSVVSVSGVIILAGGETAVPATLEAQ